jgi:hypothetical protein
LTNGQHNMADSVLDNALPTQGRGFEGSWPDGPALKKEPLHVLLPLKFTLEKDIQGDTGVTSGLLRYAKHDLVPQVSRIVL